MRRIASIALGFLATVWSVADAERRYGGASQGLYIVWFVGLTALAWLALWLIEKAWTLAQRAYDNRYRARNVTRGALRRVQKRANETLSRLEEEGRD